MAIYNVVVVVVIVAVAITVVAVMDVVVAGVDARAGSVVPPGDTVQVGRSRDVRIGVRCCTGGIATGTLVVLGEWWHLRVYLRHGRSPATPRTWSDHSDERVTLLRGTAVVCTLMMVMMAKLLCRSTQRCLLLPTATAIFLTELVWVRSIASTLQHTVERIADAEVVASRLIG